MITVTGGWKLRLLIRCQAGNDPIRLDAIKGVLHEGLGVVEVAKALGVQHSQVSRWVAECRQVLIDAVAAEGLDVGQLRELGIDEIEEAERWGD